MANAQPAGVIRVGYISDISLFVFKPRALETPFGAPIPYATHIFPIKATTLHHCHVSTISIVYDCIYDEPQISIYLHDYCSDSCRVDLSRNNTHSSVGG